MTFDEKGLHDLLVESQDIHRCHAGSEASGVKDVAGVAKLYGQGTSG